MTFYTKSSCGFTGFSKLLCLLFREPILHSFQLGIHSMCMCKRKRENRDKGWLSVVFYECLFPGASGKPGPG
jgi:hypothetical protein